MGLLHIAQKKALGLWFHYVLYKYCYSIFIHRKICGY